MEAKIRNTPVDWEEIYATADRPVWKLSPHSYTKNAAELANGGTALDIGSGEGHDALYLAKAGYETTAIDMSADALSNMKKIANEINVSVTSIVADASRLTLDVSYDVITSYGFLHFAGKDSFGEYINHLQERTNPGGVHAFYTFGDIGNFHDIGAHKYWFPDRTSLSSLYQEWEIHEIDERTVKMLVKGDKGESLYNSMIKILVQKPA